ncbi:MAG: DNA repair protein RadA [Eubacteriales bacterium]|nr:DNA repair protein RadA [Eubacteriales bacterium]
MKDKSLFVCGECGYETAKWMGRCPQCGSWNTLVEEERIKVDIPPSQEKPTKLNKVSISEDKRILTGIGELDRVLGGGLVGGMVVLLGGDPGIGKSTLLLQAANKLTAHGQVLYVSGEESKSQIKLRASRLNIDSELLIYCDTSLERLLLQARETKCRFLIVDSIQTMVSDSVASAAGSITQVRTATALLTQFAKETGTIVLIVGHVTKDGTLAGPRVMEHIVDTVLYFEGDRQEGLRLLRSVKNRFGSTNELGVFEMCDDGMHEVTDPSRLFLSGQSTTGCAVTCMMEGTRPLLAETQALLVPTAFGSPRRTAIGTDIGRLNLLLAVLEKKALLKVSDKDVYCNVVGSLKLVDRGADLAVSLAVASALLDTPLPKGTTAIGEVGLTGELRSVARMDARVKECARQGYTNILVPKNTKVKCDDATLLHVENIGDAVRYLVKGEGAKK